MQTSTAQAIKVGLAIILAVVIFFFGIRYFEGIPLKGMYEITTEFDHVDGMIPGNIILINGVTIGSIADVSLDNQTRNVLIHMRINNGVEIPIDSHTEITGFSAFGGVQINIVLGDSPQLIQHGDALPSEQVSLLTHASEFAKPYVNQFDSVLTGLNGTLYALQNQLDEPTSDVRQTLTSLNSMTSTLDQVVRTERTRMQAIMQSLQTTLTNADQLTVTSKDSLARTLNQLNQTLQQTDQTLLQLQTMSVNLNTLLTKINSGQGTLGLLANDPSLYHQMDSTFSSLNRLLTDFEADPKRYLKHIKPVDIF